MAIKNLIWKIDQKSLLSYSASVPPPVPPDEELPPDVEPPLDEPEPDDEPPPLGVLVLPGFAEELPEVDGAAAFLPSTSRLKWVTSVFT